MLDVTAWAIVRGHEVFRDDANADLFWVLPGALDVALDEEGRPKLSLMAYRGEGSQGGMLTVTFRLATTEQERSLVADDLRRMLGRQVQVRPVELTRARVSLGAEDTLLGEGPLSPMGHLAVTANVPPPLTTAVRRALEHAEALPVRARVAASGRRPAMDGTVTLDLGRARAELETLGPGPISDRVLREAFGGLLEQGVIRLEAMSPSTRVIDAAQAMLTDALLEPVGQGQWRLAAAGDDPPPTINASLGRAAPLELRRALGGDLAALLARHGEAPTVREVDLEADDFFATRELKVEVLGDFEAQQIHAVVVEVRAGQELRSEVFEAQGGKTLRFRGRPSLELRTRVMPRGRDDVMGDGGERISPWRSVDEQIVILVLDQLAPLWRLELEAGAVDWGSYSHLEVIVRYASAQRSVVLTRDTAKSTVLIRPQDPTVQQVEVKVRYLGPGGTGERILNAEAPSTVVIGPLNENQ